MKGKTLTFALLFSSLDFYKFRITKTPEGISDNKKTATFFIELDNVILRYLADPITTVYDIANKSFSATKDFQTFEIHRVKTTK